MKLHVLHVSVHDMGGKKASFMRGLIMRCCLELRVTASDAGATALAMWGFNSCPPACLSMWPMACPTNRSKVITECIFGNQLHGVSGRNRSGEGGRGRKSSIERENMACEIDITRSEPVMAMNEPWLRYICASL